jgi:hypothetical protein
MESSYIISSYDRDYYPPIYKPFTHEFYTSDDKLYFVRRLGRGIRCVNSQDPTDTTCPDEVREQIPFSELGDLMLASEELRRANKLMKQTVYQDEDMESYDYHPPKIERDLDDPLEDVWDREQASLILMSLRDEELDN